MLHDNVSKRYKKYTLMTKKKFICWDIKVFLNLFFFCKKMIMKRRLYFYEFKHFSGLSGYFFCLWYKIIRFYSIILIKNYFPKFDLLILIQLKQFIDQYFSALLILIFFHFEVFKRNLYSILVFMIITKFIFSFLF